MSYWVYILASGRNGTLYVGVTGSLPHRVTQHRTGSGSKFAQKYAVHLLVHAEEFESPQEGIQRESNIRSGPGDGRL